MTNPFNTVNLTVSEELYYKLNEIRLAKNITFNQVINDLCDLELQNNFIEKIAEFEFCTENSIGAFQVTFKKNTFSVKYITSKGLSGRINDWNIENKDKRLFQEFIHQDYARCMLENLEICVEFKKFMVHKLGTI